MNQVKSFIATALIVISTSFASTTAQANEEGASNYKRCAACHLATGEGVPGAFPAINNRLTGVMGTKVGRDYLILVINSGLMGPIEVNGMTYRGIMPAQGAALKPAGIAAVLNYIATDLSQSNGTVAQFTEAEVTATILSSGKINSRKVHELRKIAIDSTQSE